jgi:hypothetical protein
MSRCQASLLPRTDGVNVPGSFASRIGDGADEGILGLPRIEPSLLDDNRNVGFDHRREISVALALKA